MADKNETSSSSPTAERPQELQPAPLPMPSDHFAALVSVPRSQDRAPVVIGALLVIVGVVFLVGQVITLPVEWSTYGWPAYVIGPGLALLVAAAVGGKSWSFLAIPGSIVTTVGAILFVQNATDLWQTWAYVWTLIFPTAVGLGKWFQGVLDDDAKCQQSGRKLAIIGVGMFLAFAFFFEGLIGLSHLGSTDLVRIGFPAALIVAGGLLLGSRVRTTSG
jgi:hypothetical protein